MRIKRLLSVLLCLMITMSLWQYPVQVKAAIDESLDRQELLSKSMDIYGYDISGLEFRGTTIVYLATTVMVNIGSAITMPVEASVNAVLYGSSYISDDSMETGLKGTAFDTPSRYPLFTSSAAGSDSNYTFNYLVDTIDKDKMQTRYLTSSKSEKWHYPCVSLDDNTTMASYINATMDSSAMAGVGKENETVLKPEVFLQNKPILEETFLKKLVGDSTYRIPLVSLTTSDDMVKIASVKPLKLESVGTVSDDGTLLITASGKDFLCSYDWSSYFSYVNTYKLITAVIPIIMPTYRQNGATVNPTGLNTVLKEDEKPYLYTNLEYLSYIGRSFHAYDPYIVLSDIDDTAAFGVVSDRGAFIESVGSSYSSGSNSLNLESASWSKIMSTVLMNASAPDTTDEIGKLNTYKRLVDVSSDTGGKSITAVNHSILYELTNLVASRYAISLVNLHECMKFFYPNITVQDYAIWSATLSGLGYGYNSNDGGTDYINKISSGDISGRVYNEKRNQLCFNESDSESIYTVLGKAKSLQASNSLYVNAFSSGNVSNILAGRIYNIKSESGSTNKISSDLSINFQNMVNLWYGDRQAAVVSSKTKGTSLEYILFPTVLSDNVSETLVQGLSAKPWLKMNTSDYTFRELVGQRISPNKLLLSCIQGSPMTNGSLFAEMTETSLKVHYKSPGVYSCGYNIYAYIDPNSDENREKLEEAVKELKQEVTEEGFTDTCRKNKIEIDKSYLQLYNVEDCWIFNSNHNTASEDNRNTISNHAGVSSEHDCICENYLFTQQFTDAKNSTREYLTDSINVDTVEYVGTALSCLNISASSDTRRLANVLSGYFQPVRMFGKEEESVLEIPLELLPKGMYLVFVPIYIGMRMQTEDIAGVSIVEYRSFGFTEVPPAFPKSISTIGPEVRGFTNGIVVGSPSLQTATSIHCGILDSRGLVQLLFSDSDEHIIKNGVSYRSGTTAVSVCSEFEWSSATTTGPMGSNARTKIESGGAGPSTRLEYLEVGIVQDQEAKGAGWGAYAIDSSSGSVSKTVQTIDSDCNLMAEMSVDVFPQVIYDGLVDGEDIATFDLGVADKSKINSITLTIDDLTGSTGDVIHTYVSSKGNYVTGETEVSLLHGKDATSGVQLLDSGKTITYSSPDVHKENESSPCSYCSMCNQINKLLEQYYVTVDTFGLQDNFDKESVLDGMSIKWTLEFGFTSGGSSAKIEGAIKPKAYKWEATVSGDHTPNPIGNGEVATTIKWKTTVDVPETDGQLFCYYPYKYTQQFKPGDEEVASYEVSNLNHGTSVMEVGTNKTELKTGTKPKYKTPKELYEDTGATLDVEGTFEKKAAESTWTCYNIITLYPAKRDNVSELVSGAEVKFEGTHEIDWTDKVSLTGYFDKEVADYDKDILLTLQTFNYKTLMPEWESLSASDVEFHRKDKTMTVTMKDTSVKISDDGDVEISLTWSTGVKRDYFVNNFYVTIKGKDFPLTGSDALEFNKVTVPVTWPDPIFLLEVSPGGRTFTVDDDEAGDITIPYVAKFKPNTEGGKYEDWVRMMFTEEASKNPDGTAWARIALNVTLTGNITVKSFNVGDTNGARNLSSVENQKVEIYWKEFTNTDLAEIINGFEVPFDITFAYPKNAEGTINFGTSTTGTTDSQDGSDNSFGRVCFTSGKSAKRTQKRDCSGLIEGDDVIEGKPRITCIEWDYHTDVTNPYAVLTSTAPAPEEWRWDLMSGIPNTETMSATVGADLYRVGISGRVHGLGETQNSSVRERNKSGLQGTALTNPATTRTLTFEVNFTNWWGANDSTPCSLSCSGHPVCNGGTSHTVTLSGSTSLSGNASWNNGSKTESCPVCGKSVTATCGGHSGPGYNVKTDSEGHVISRTPRTATVSCSCSYTHSCTWSYTWNCSSNSGSISRASESSASASPTSSETANLQRWNLTNVTVTNGNETVTRNYINESTLDKGFTVGYGCQCSRKHNMAHSQSNKQTFTITEDSDAVVWKAIDNFYISALSNAEIVRADNDILNAEGRSVLTNGLEFSMWRADDSGIITLCEAKNNQPNAGNTLLGTGRMYYTDFKSPNAEGATIPTANYTHNSDVKIVFTTVTNRATYQKYIDANGEIKPKIEEYVKAEIYRGNYGGSSGHECGCGQDVHYDDSSVTSNVTEYKTGFVGDKSNATELTYAAALIVNNWLKANAADNYYKINFVGDAVSVKYDDMVQNVAGWVYSIPGADVNLFNCTFDTTRKAIYRNHISGQSLTNVIASSNNAGSLVQENSGSLFLGFGGVYAPASRDAMYIRRGNLSEYNLVEVLGEGETPFDGKNNTNFKRASSINTGIYTATGNPGLTKGNILLSGTGTVTMKDEYYGLTVDDVSSNVVQTMNPGGTNTTGESLLNFHQDGFTISDNNRMSFLGITFDEETPNRCIEDPMTIQCNYKCLFKYISTSTDMAKKVENLSGDFSRICLPPSGFNGGTNPVVVLNPVAVNAWMIGNGRGDTSIYSVDESHEDMRDNDSKVKAPGEYVVIGNTFNIWVSDIGPADAKSSTRDTKPNIWSWGNGVSSDKALGTVTKGTYGLGGDLITTQWIDQRYIQFDFPVSYVARDGSVVHVQAGQRIQLDIDTTYSPADGDLPTDCIPTLSGVCKDSDFAYGYFSDYGRGYTFTCELSAKENVAAKATITHGNSLGGGVFTDSLSNYTDRSNIVADSKAKQIVDIVIVGRIGDLVMTDTQDYRYSNLFWETTDKWLIPDVVKETNLTSRLNIRTTNNILMNKLAPAYGTVQEGLASTTGIVDAMLKYPLQASSNNINEFKSTNLGLGYSAYFGISTIGSYTGKSLSNVYPTSFQEAFEGKADLRNNYVAIEPIYVLYDPEADDGKGQFFDIDLYAGSGINYELFYDYACVQPNYTNALYSTLDDATEQSRYAVSDFAKYYSMYFNDDIYSAFTEKAYVGTSRRLVLDNRSNMVIGTRSIESQPVSYNLSENRYQFTDYLATSATPTAGGQGDADYALNARRWFFNLGLPTSTVAVYPGEYSTPLAITNANQKLVDEHPKGVIVCFIQAKAVGDVFTLILDSTYTNSELYDRGNIKTSGSAIELCGKSVNYVGCPTYIDDRISYNLSSYMLPVFVSDLKRTSTQDLGMQGTN